MAVVIKRVNTRIAAHTAAQKLNPLEIGETIDVQGLEFGEPIHGNRIWLVNDNKRYWSGAFDVDFRIDNCRSSLFTEFDVPTMWKYSTGIGVTVAVIDCGVQLGHKSITNSDVQVRTSGPIGDCLHGTYMSSIISGSDIESGFLGVAPNARILSCSIDIKNCTARELENCLRLISEADIVNLSFATTHQSFKRKNQTGRDLSDFIKQEALFNKKIFVAATGNCGQQADVTFFPAAYEDVISVSAYNGLEVFTEANFWPGVSLVGSFSPFYDLDDSNDFSENVSGTSPATAFVSGILAVLLSHFKRKNISLNRTELVECCSTPITLLNRHLKNCSSRKLDKEKIFETLKSQNL